MRQIELTLKAPLSQDADGTIRLKGSRITLDTLVGAFKRGDSPEQIQEGFPSLSVAQINDALAWYLNNRVSADEYLNQRAAEARAIRDGVESGPEYVIFRELMRRRREQ